MRIMIDLDGVVCELKKPGQTYGMFELIRAFGKMEQFYNKPGNI